jgi:hypothetical protein
MRPPCHRSAAVTVKIYLGKIREAIDIAIARSFLFFAITMLLLIHGWFRMIYALRPIPFRIPF